MNEVIYSAGAETIDRTKEAGSGLLPFFVLTFLTSWAIWSGLFWPSFREVSPLLVTCVGAYAPTAWGIYFTHRHSGNAGLRDLFARLIRVRVPVAWLLAAILLKPLCETFTAGLATLFLGQTPAFSAHYLTPQFVLWVMVVGGPLNEELGWRGFALPRLLQKRSPLAASVGLGVVWAFWHLPLFFAPGWPGRGQWLTIYVVSVVCFSIFMTAAHLGTRGSLLIAVLFHTSGDAAALLWHYPSSTPWLQLCALLPWLIVAGTILTFKRASWLVSPSDNQPAQPHRVRPNA